MPRWDVAYTMSLSTLKGNRSWSENENRLQPVWSVFSRHPGSDSWCGGAEILSAGIRSCNDKEANFEGGSNSLDIRHCCRGGQRFMCTKRPVGYPVLSRFDLCVDWNIKYARKHDGHIYNMYWLCQWVCSSNKPLFEIENSQTCCKLVQYTWKQKHLNVLTLSWCVIRTFIVWSKVFVEICEGHCHSKRWNQCLTHYLPSLTGLNAASSLMLHWMAVAAFFTDAGSCKPLTLHLLSERSVDTVPCLEVVIPEHLKIFGT